MDTSKANWCQLLAGTVTPELVARLREAADMAEDAGNQTLAEDLRRWEQRLLQALEIGRSESAKDDNSDSEIWLG